MLTLFLKSTTRKVFLAMFAATAVAGLAVSGTGIAASTDKPVRIACAIKSAKMQLLQDANAPLLR